MIADPANRQRAPRLEGDTLDAFLALCASDLPPAQVVDRMWADHGQEVALSRVYKTRSRLGITGLPSDNTRCARCRTAPATHPGLPVGLRGRVCLSCQQAVIDGRAEERWQEGVRERRRRVVIAAAFPA